MTRVQQMYVCGATILAALSLYVWLNVSTGSTTFLLLMFAAGGAYLLALTLVQHAPDNRRALGICLLMAALWRLPLLVTPAGARADVLRYLWDARLQRLGYNPYRAIPADPALAHVHTTETRLMNNPTLPSPYPPGAQYFFRAVTTVYESVFAVRLALILCDGLIALFLFRWLLESGRRTWWTLAYAWNPLVAIEAAGNGHVDMLGALLVFSAFLLLSRGRTRSAILVLTLAVSVKFLPVVLVPLFWKRARLKDWLLGGAVLVVLYLPFIVTGGLAFGSLGAFVDRFRFNDPVFSLAERIVPPRVAAGFAVCVGLGVACWMRWRLRSDHPAAWGWTMAATLLCAPVIYPWYLLWLTPFLTTGSTLPLIVWTQSILTTYVVWHDQLTGAPWRVPAWATLTEFAVVACAGVWLLVRRRQTHSR